MITMLIPRSLSKSIALAFATAALSATAIAAPTLYNETVPGTGDLTGSAEVAGTVGSNALTIMGNLRDGRGGNLPNIADLFAFSVDMAGTYYFDTYGSRIFDPQLSLFDAAGNGIIWNNDASITPSDTQSAMAVALGVGNYFIGISFAFVDAIDSSNAFIFDALGNGGPAMLGAGALAGWSDGAGLGQFGTLWDITAYTINAQVPEPGALTLSLAALGLLAGLSRRQLAKTA